MLFRIEVEIPDDMMLLSLQGKNDGSWTAAVKAKEPFYINSPCGVSDGLTCEEAITAAAENCRRAMERYRDETIRGASRVGPSNGSTRHGPEKLSDIF